MNLNIYQKFLEYQQTYEQDFIRKKARYNKYSKYVLTTYYFVIFTLAIASLISIGTQYDWVMVTAIGFITIGFSLFINLKMNMPRKVISQFVFLTTLLVIITYVDFNYVEVVRAFFIIYILQKFMETMNRAVIINIFKPSDKVKNIQKINYHIHDQQISNLFLYYLQENKDYVIRALSNISLKIKVFLQLKIPKNQTKKREDKKELINFELASQILNYSYWKKNFKRQVVEIEDVDSFINFCKKMNSDELEKYRILTTLYPSLFGFDLPFSDTPPQIYKQIELILLSYIDSDKTYHTDNYLYSMYGNNLPMIKDMMFEKWNELKELEPNLLSVLIDNHQMINKFLYVQDFQITEDEFEYLQNYEAILDKKLSQKNVSSQVNTFEYKLFNEFLDKNVKHLEKFKIIEDNLYPENSLRIKKSIECVLDIISSLNPSLFNEPDIKLWVRVLKKEQQASNLDSFFVKGFSDSPNLKLDCIFENSLNINENTRKFIDTIDFQDLLFSEIPESNKSQSKTIKF